MSILALLPMLTLCVGIYFLVRLRFFFILHPIKSLKSIFFSGFDKNERRALSLALAGTLGVGNIVVVTYDGVIKEGNLIEGAINMQKGFLAKEDFGVLIPE